MVMPNENLVPPNLAELGVKMKGNPDLHTIWVSPYPVIVPYKELCTELNIAPFGGGTIEKQGPLGLGRINSGFRDIKYNRTVGGARNSAHCFALALDIEFRNFEMVRRAALIASNIYNRIILYGKPFLHVDQTNSLWHMNYSNGMRFGLSDQDGNFCWRENIHQIIELHKDLYK